MLRREFGDEEPEPDALDRLRAGSRQRTVPVDVGVRPATYLITGPVFADQPIHFGLKVSLAAGGDEEGAHAGHGRPAPRAR